MSVLENLSEFSFLKNEEIDPKIMNYCSSALLFRIGNIVCFHALFDKNLHIINTMGTTLFNLKYSLKHDVYINPHFTLRKNGNFDVGSYSAFESNKFVAKRHFNFVFICNN